MNPPRLIVQNSKYYKYSNSDKPLIILIINNSNSLDFLSQFIIFKSRLYMDGFN